MTDIEVLVKEHLSRVAAQAVPRRDIDSVLSDGAPVPLSRRTAAPRRWTRAFAVAAALITIAGVIAFTRSDDSTTVSTAGEERPSHDADDPASTDTSSLRLTVLQPPTDRGFAVIDEQEIRLYDPAGVVVARGDGAMATREWPDGPLAVDWQEGNTLSVSAASNATSYANRGLAPDQDCVELDGSPFGSVETCSTSEADVFGRQLVHVGADGARRTLVGAIYPGDVYPGSTTAVAGHWAGAEISPDGRWIAAQWSGECEVPTAFLVRVEDGAIFGPTGTPLGPTIDEFPAESTVLGWDGQRALVALRQGACGSAPRSAVLSVDPAAGTSTELLPLAVSEGIVTERVLAWTLDT